MAAEGIAVIDNRASLSRAHCDCAECAVLSTTSGRYQNIRPEHLAVAGQHWSCSTAALQQVTPAPGLCIIYQAPNLANTSILHTAGLNLTTLYYQVCVLYLLCYTPPQSKYMYLYRGVEIISTSVVHIGYENIKIVDSTKIFF